LGKVLITRGLPLIVPKNAKNGGKGIGQKEYNWGAGEVYKGRWWVYIVIEWWE